MNFRNLRADEIDVRVGNALSTGYTLLLYKDARCDMNILDEQIGTENWQRDHKEIKGNLYCGVGIWDEKKSQWVWKWDCGTESNTEKEKGEASDSFKRACFNLGIGRELYTSPFIKIDCQMVEDKDRNGKTIYKLPKEEINRKFKVKEIHYNNKNEIDKLVIVDNKGVQVYPKSTFTGGKSVEDLNKEMDDDLICAKCGDWIDEKVYKYSKSKYGKPLCRDCQKEQ